MVIMILQTDFMGSLMGISISSKLKCHFPEQILDIFNEYIKLAKSLAGDIAYTD